jgi:formylmethanofuran dehydrogenase subunit E
MQKIDIKLKAIGLIHSPFKNTNEAPRQGNSEVCQIEIFNEYEEGLTDVDEFSHLIILYYLNKSNNYNLLQKTPWDDTPHGVFTTRSPHRPNPIGYSVVNLLERKENILTIKGIDAIDNTPVLDIKPYIKKLDCKENVKSGWAEKTDI